jgi:hypothetical protein
MLTRPARDVDPDDVVQAVAEGMRKTGYNEFSLLSLSCSDYLALPSVGLQIKNLLQEDNVSLSLPSQVRALLYFRLTPCVSSPSLRPRNRGR